MNFNKKKYFVLVLLILLTLIIGEFWLAIGAIFLCIFFALITKALDIIKNAYYKKRLKVFFSFIFFLSIVLSIKIFAFSIFKIPSSSMENQLFPNDIILVNKLKYGPRLPRSPFDIPWVNIAFYFNDSAKKRLKENWWSYKRLSGTTVIEQGDVMVFNSTWDKNFILVKRCVALSGDTLTLKMGKIYTNGDLLTEPTSVNLKANNYLGNTSTNDHSDRNLFFDNWGNWDYNNIGPIIIPTKGMTIPLNAKNFAVYKKAIRLGERKTIKHHQGKYYINNVKTNTYTFKHDYYFMMGDNRDATEDSRAWGFLPKENIIGKVDYILYSIYGGSFNWDRFLKAVY